MTRQETDDPADSRLAVSHNQFVFNDVLRGCINAKGRKVVVKNKRIRVVRIAHTTSSFITGTQIAFWIVRREGFRRVVFDLPLPGPIGSMGRNQHAISRERIMTTMRVS